MSKNIFNSVKLTRPNKNVFDLTHDVKLSFDIGKLVPVCLMECVPGDKFNMSYEALVKFAPLVAPVMHHMNLYFHTYFVPNRLVWDGWQYYITRTYRPGEVSIPAFPFVTISDASTPITPGSLPNYLGLPPTKEPDATPLPNSKAVSALPFYVYNKVYNDYYRDENLVPDPLLEVAVDGSNNAFWGAISGLQMRSLEKDYFTSALPWAQKGEIVNIPLGYNEIGINSAVPTTLTGAPTSPVIQSLSGGPFSELNADRLYTAPTNDNEMAGTINDLRFAQKLQIWFEKMARGGSRYNEQILEHFGVRSSDKRLQRAEYIGGMKTGVVISETLNTTGTDDLPQGNMSGNGIAVGAGNGASYFCEEHGYIIVIMSLLPRTAYMQGIPKHWLKINDSYEFFWPTFANIGEQEIDGSEIYAYDDAITQPFGYTPRYAEYKYMSSRICGDFYDTLDYWHMGQIYSSPPALNRQLIECNFVDYGRIFAVTDTTVNKLYAHVLNKIYAVRPMPKYGTPY